MRWDFRRLLENKLTTILRTGAVKQASASFNILSQAVIQAGQAACINIFSLDLNANLQAEQTEHRLFAVILFPLDQALAGWLHFR